MQRCEMLSSRSMLVHWWLKTVMMMSPWQRCHLVHLDGVAEWALRCTERKTLLAMSKRYSLRALYTVASELTCHWKGWKEFLIGTVLYKTKSLDGTKPNTNPKTNHNPNTNPIQLFFAFYKHRPMIYELASFGRFSHRFNTVLLLKGIERVRANNCYYLQ